MSILYAPVQFMRIITQRHLFAVLDQWFTLPLFMWTIVWYVHLSGVESSRKRSILIMLMTLSFSSYLLSLVYMHGFESSFGVTCFVSCHGYC